MNVGHGGDAAAAVLRSMRRRCQNQICLSTILATGRALAIMGTKALYE